MLLPDFAISLLEIASWQCASPFSGKFVMRERLDAANTNGTEKVVAQHAKVDESRLMQTLETAVHAGSVAFGDAPNKVGGHVTKVSLSPTLKRAGSTDAVTIEDLRNTRMLLQSGTTDAVTITSADVFSRALIDPKVGADAPSKVMSETMKSRAEIELALNAAEELLQCTVRGGGSKAERKAS